MRRNVVKKSVACAIIVMVIGINCAHIVTGIAFCKNDVTALLNSAVEKNPQADQPASFAPRGYFYAYNAYDPNGMPNGEVTFDMDAVVNFIGSGAGIMVGEDIDINGNCYGVALGGGLYSIDLATGTFTLIAPTISLNSLTYDTTAGIWYTCTTNNLDTIDISTGAIIIIGSFGTNISMSILMVDISGTMYGFGSSGGDTFYLYVIDKTTGEATPIGDMGLHYPFMYPVGATFDRNDGTLYVSVYDLGQGVSYLAMCDPATGVVTTINMFSPTGIEIVGLCIPYTPPDHYLIPDFFWTPLDPLPGETVLFNASTSYDSGGNITLYEWDWDNDGVYEESHTTPTAAHSWDTPDRYTVTLRVTDNMGLTAEKSHVVEVVSQPPLPPVLHGPDNGIVNVSYTFSTDPITDPNGDSFYCKWDWGDGDITEWLGPYPSGSIISASHTWTHVGVYEIRAKLKGSGGNSNWSEPHVITIVNMTGPPTTPIITGPTHGKVNVKYDYTFNSTDQNCDVLMYMINWGDGTYSNTSGPSGTETVMSHTWSKKGTFTIMVKARDVWGAMSDWGRLPVTMPCASSVAMLPFFTWFFERFPHVFPLLHYVLKL